MELSDYISALRRRWLLIIALGLIGGVIAFGMAQDTPRMYKSTTSVFVSTQRGDTTTELVQGSTFAQNLIQSYAKLAVMPSVLEPVITKLHLGTTPAGLAKSISADTPLNTVLINITVSNSSPARAAEIANAVAASLSITAQRLAPKDSQGIPAITMQQVAEAQPALYPFSPNTKFMVATGILSGLFIGIVYSLALQILNTRLRRESDLRGITKLPLIGRMYDRGRRPSNDIIFRQAPDSHDAESFRRLAANLRFINPDSAVRSVVVTSALPNEGKSGTSINLALALAERFDRVLLVDADLRRPRVANYCGIEGGVGLTTVLSGAAELADVIEPWGTIDILPAGALPPNPSQLTGSAAMAATVLALIAEYDLVVFDSAPLLPVADTLPLTRITDGALVVMKYNSTRRGQLQAALQAVDAVNGNVLGLVLNRVKRSRNDKQYGYESEVPSTWPDASAHLPLSTGTVASQAKSDWSP